MSKRKVPHQNRVLPAPHPRRGQCMAGCGQVARHQARMGATYIGLMCCPCMDRFMGWCSTLVPPDEGREGLAEFRAQHFRECFYLPRLAASAPTPQ